MRYRFPASGSLALAIAIGIASLARAQDWPQWRGPLGQGITAAKNLPGSNSLKVLWKTTIPGEGCSSPIVCDGRVYVTTAYEGSERHALDVPAYWASIVLTCAVLALSIPRVRGTSPWGFMVIIWTLAVVGLTTLVLAKPRWFWQFADPWTGTTVVAAELPWVESLHLRPVIVLLCGSLILLHLWFAWDEKQDATDESPAPCLPPLAPLCTVVCSVALGLIAVCPEWFFQPSQAWLTWLVTGGIGMFALGGSAGSLGLGGWWKLLPVGVGFALAGWLFYNTPHDEFGSPLSLQNRIVYLVPGLAMILRGASGVGREASSFLVPRPTTLAPLLALLAATVFVRANYLHPQTGIVRAVLCIDAASGDVLWATPVYVAAAEKRHSLNSLATPTPACDGERVYADFGSGLAALDKNGRVLWLKRDRDYAGFIRYGAGSSVVLADERIIVYRDSEFVGHGDHLDDDIQAQTSRRPSALIAYDKATGDEVWKITPPFSHDSYMTPLVWTRGGEREVVVATWKTLAGFALGDGGLRWTHAYPMQQIVPSPAINGDVLFVTGGNALPCPIIAVRAPTQTTPAQTIWSNGKTGGNIVSPVCWAGLLFSVSHSGTLICRDAESGRPHWDKRLDNRCLASLVAGDGKVYVLDREGTLQVFAANATETLLAIHAFREECAATPALAAGRLFVRTASHLYGIGNEPRGARGTRGNAEAR